MFATKRKLLLFNEHWKSEIWVQWVVDCGNFEKCFVLFYFSSFSISLMSVDFSKWKKEECEVCFKHTQTPLLTYTYCTAVHRVVACAYIVNQCHYHPTMCIFVVLCCAVCCIVCTHWIVFFSPCENDEKRVRAQISVRVSVLIAPNTHWYYKVHTLSVCLPIDAWIKFQNKTIRYECARITNVPHTHTHVSIWFHAPLKIGILV